MTTDRIAFGTFDIETVPNPSLPEECIPTFDESEVTLGNLKDPEKISAKLESARLAFEGKKISKMSCDPDLLMICSFVGYDAVNDTHLELTAVDEEQERILLAEAWLWIRNMVNSGKLLVSFNGRTFDVPALARRAMLQDVFVDRKHIKPLMGRTAQDNIHLDLMIALENPSPFGGRNFHNFDYYCRSFGLPGKIEGWDGSKVYPAFVNRWMEDILLYCKNDVAQLTELFRRVSPWLVEERTENAAPKSGA